MKGGEQKSLNVLIADDDPSDVFIVSRGLSEFSHKCNLFDAKDGEQLLMMLGIDPSTGRPSTPNPKLPKLDLILIDLFMPKIYGLQVLKMIKRDRRYQQTPCVIMSTNLSDYDRSQAEGMGAAGAIQKPATLSDFRAAIRSVEFSLIFNLDPEPIQSSQNHRLS
ncbi:CheY-like chemotaxis protein [Litorivivens lipolytica]|uniref:CheY-like chemotaxis protein n=1 Tax=Litorivivens lipolytica TaxID=1524264 RepID=A0A7W4W386_9GAMM|nr:CheY-like chemotaxis protein [Litorivivens lipolytica]